MKIVKVPGSNKRHKVFLYALSTCGWCKKTKRLFEDNKIEFDYVDVDRCDNEELDQVRKEITKMGAPMSFPLIIIDEKTTITGYHEDEIKGALQI